MTNHPAAVIDDSRNNPNRPCSADLLDEEREALDMLRGALDDLPEEALANDDHDELASVFRSAATLVDFLRPLYQTTEVTR